MSDENTKTAKQVESTTAETSTPSTTEEKAVPYERFQEVVSQKNEFKQKLDDLMAEVHTAKAQVIELKKVKKQFDEYKEQFKAAQNEWTQKKELYQLGMNDEALEVATLFYGRQDFSKAGDKPSLSGWIKSLKESPDTAPIALKPYLGSEAKNAVLPKSNTVVNTTDKGEAMLTRDKIRSMSTEEYQKHRDFLLEQLRKRN